jgi:hypothetical protein
MAGTGGGGRWSEHETAFREIGDSVALVVACAWFAKGSGFIAVKESAIIAMCLVLELVFTKLILKILHWIYALAIYSRVFILDVPTYILRLVKSILFLFGGELSCYKIV